MFNSNLENEKIKGKIPLLSLLCLSFFLIYFIPQLGMTEFRWRKEALYTAIAFEMNFSRPNTIAHGELISETYPLFPMAVALLLRAGVPVSFASRLVSIFFVAAISVGIWATAKRAYGKQASIVASTVFFSSLIVMDKGMEGFPEMMAFFWIFLAWMSWFVIGAQKSRWNTAWFISFTFCGLSFYTIGWEALFYFFLPLIFLRRPLSIWSRLNKSGFYLGLTALLFFVVVWSYPRWIDGHDIPFRNISREISGGYAVQLLFFPLEFFLRTFPWIFIIWPIFCAAYDEIEKNPIFSRFLKTIFFTLFFINWFIPGNDPRKFTLMIIPLAILAGSKYDILVRRQSTHINKFLIYLTRIIALTAFLCAVFYVLPQNLLQKLTLIDKKLAFLDSYWIFGLPQTLFVIVICIYLEKLYTARKLPIFKHLLLISTAMMTIFWGVHVPYRSHIPEQRKWASEIRQVIGDDYGKEQIIYETPEVSGDFYGVIAYLGYKAKRLKNGLKEIPEEIQTVYLLSSDVPIMPERLWTKKITFERKKRNYSLWTGEKIKKSTR